MVVIDQSSALAAVNRRLVAQARKPAEDPKSGADHR